MIMIQRTGREDAEHLAEDEEEGGLCEVGRSARLDTQRQCRCTKASNSRVKMKDDDTHPCWVKASKSEAIYRRARRSREGGRAMVEEQGKVREKTRSARPTGMCLVRSDLPSGEL